MNDPADEDDKLQALFDEWERDEPGSTDVDTPPASAPEGEMRMEGLDLREPDVSEEPPVPDQAPQGGRDVPQGAPPRAGGGPMPKPDPSTLDWKGLGERLKTAEQQRALSQGAENLFANVGAQSGYRINPHAGDAWARIAAQPLELAKEKQGLESRELAMKGQKDAMGVKAAMDDPNSLQSQKARESVKAFFGDQPLPRGFDGWSANDVQRFASSGTLARVAQMKNAASDDARKVADKAAKDQKEAEQLAEMRKTWAPELKAAGKDPTTVTKFDIQAMMQAQHNKATEKVAESNNAIARSNESRKQNEFDALKQDIPFAGGTLKYSGTGTPREEDVREAQKHAGLYGAAIRGMDDLENAMSDFARHPGASSRDNVVAKTQAVAGHLNTALGQGAMSKDEKSEMAKALGVDLTTPGGIQAMVDTLTGNDRAAAEAMTRRLKAVRESTRASAIGKIEPHHFTADAAPKTPKAEETPEIPKGIPSDATNVKKLKNGKWFYTLPNGEHETWRP